jgi:hypothetical protein
MAGKTAKDYAGDYTQPELRARIKERLKASAKGGRPGQWSARKSQLLAQEYRRQGGGFRRGKQAAQRSLEAWTGQDWRGAGGQARVRGQARGRGRGRMHRYLPRTAWQLLSPKEREQAERSKPLARGGAQGDDRGWLDRPGSPGSAEG